MKRHTVLAILTLISGVFTSFAQKEVSIENDFLSVKVSTLGAELQSIKSANGTEYLWQGVSAFWGDRAPIMFPVNVRFKDEKFTYKGKEYEMPRMGLAKTTTFNVLKKTSTKVVLEFKSNKKTFKNYPFLFSLIVTYELVENKLINRFDIKNIGTETMYFALGGHPGFRFPFVEERAQNQYVFSEKYDLKRTEVANSLVQTNQISWLINENCLPFGDSRIPDGGMFVKEMPSRKIGVGVVGQPAFLEVNLEDFPNVNQWTPPGMPFACIEPMVAHHDLQDTKLAIEEKDFLEKLPAGESKSYQFSIVVKHQNRIDVKTISELKSAVKSAIPGDLILLSEGVFIDEEIILSAKGTKENPIVIAAKFQGKSLVKSSVKIEGDYIHVTGLGFIDNGNLEVFGKGCRITNCKWDDSQKGKWLRILPGSSEIEIDHNTFHNKITSNQNMERGCQLVQVVVRNKNEKHHIHHNLFKNVAKGKTGNGFETLQLITENNPFDPPGGDSNTLIEDNLFVRCNGEAEIISVKSNGNLIRRNTFRACRGGLVLRHGDNNVATQNYLLGTGESGSAGIRIQGTGQVVANNYFQDLGSYGLGMMDGTPDDLYIRVENAQILFNSFINCNKNFSIGINHSKHPNGTAPKDCKIIGNIFYSDKGDKAESFIDLVQNDEPVNWTWKDNIAYGKKIPKINGIRIENPKLIGHQNGLYVPTNKTPDSKIDMTFKDKLKYDLFGNSWKNIRSVGAIQLPFKANKNQPLTEKMVGCGF